MTASAILCVGRDKRAPKHFGVRKATMVLVAHLLQLDIYRINAKIVEQYFFEIQSHRNSNPVFYKATDLARENSDPST